MSAVESIAELNERFGILDLATVVPGRGGLPKVLIASPQAHGEMYLHGSHVTSWIPKHAAEVIYCSSNTLWQDGHAIRGGVPICFPWFGDKADDRKAPAHGFVRTKAWKLASISQVEAGVAVTMTTANDDDTRKWWPHEFRLECCATFAAELNIALTVTNTGSAAFSVEEALHAYFHVGDAQQLAIRGLSGTHYIDKVDHFTEKSQDGDVRLTGETDRVYLQTTHDLEIVDPALNRNITIRKQNSQNTVVWNPWAEKAAAMTDLGAGQWKKFVCVETANTGDAAVSVAPGEAYAMAVKVGFGGA